MNMKSVVAAVLLGVFLCSPALADDRGAETGSLQDTRAAVALLTPAPPEAIYAGCCKHCSKGKACGDSCISRSKSCNKGPGCACD